MASPTADPSASDNMPEAVTLEGGSKAAPGRERTASNKTDSSKSPPVDCKAKGPQVKKSVSVKTGGSVWTEDSADANGQQQQQQQSGVSRKKRARATPSDDSETSGRKSATDTLGRESSLWPGTEGEGPVQGSLLEEVLAEKRMALMRSPEVMQFLQQKQMMIQAAQQRAILEAQQVDFCVGEVEEDANS